MVCKNCGNEIEENAVYCSKCGNKIKPNNKNKKKCYILIIIVLLIIGILGIILINSNNKNNLTTTSNTSIQNNTSNNTTTDKKITADDVKVNKIITSTHTDDATDLVCTIAWQPIIKTFPNAKWNSMKIIDADGYGRYIVDVDYVRTQVSETGDNTYVYVLVKDFNERLGKPLIWGPDYYNFTNSYDWGKPITND